jgi:hypothetical protein
MTLTSGSRLSVMVCQTVAVGDSHKGPLIIKENPFLRKIIKTQTNSPTANYTPNNYGPGDTDPGTPRAKLRLAQGARRRNTKTPPRSRAGRPLGRNSASLEGWTTPRAKFRFARGLDAPSGETPPRSRTVRTLGRDSASIVARVGPPPQARDAAPMSHPVLKAKPNALITRAPGSSYKHA